MLWKLIFYSCFPLTPFPLICSSIPFLLLFFCNVCLAFALLRFLDNLWMTANCFGRWLKATRKVPQYIGVAQPPVDPAPVSFLLTFNFNVVGAAMQTENLRRCRRRIVVVPIAIAIARFLVLLRWCWAVIIWAPAIERDSNIIIICKHMHLCVCVSLQATDRTYTLHCFLCLFLAREAQLTAAQKE